MIRRGRQDWIDRAAEQFLRAALCLVLLLAPSAQAALAASAAGSPEDARYALLCGGTIDGASEGAEPGLPCDHCLLCAIPIAIAPTVESAPPLRDAALGRISLESGSAARNAPKAPWRARAPPTALLI